MDIERRLAIFFSRGSYVVFLGIYIALQVLVGQHLFLFKYNYQKIWEDETFKPGSPNYEMKILFKCVCVLFKVSLCGNYCMLALTMCKWSVTNLKRTFLRKFIPFNHFLELHKFCGYFGFFMLWGLFVIYMVNWCFLCSFYMRGLETWNYCKDFTSEIMITGYFVIFFHTLSFIASLPFVRNKCYELFYVTHHVFIGIFLLTIFHPYDWRHREGHHQRYQSFTLVIGPLIWYVIDKMICLFQIRSITISKAILTLHPQEKNIFLQLDRPYGYKNIPGQIGWLNCRALDRFEWHPFSLANSSNRLHIDFMIKCHTNGWTEQFFDFLACCTFQVPFVPLRESIGYKQNLQNKKLNMFDDNFLDDQDFENNEPSQETAYPEEEDTKPTKEEASEISHNVIFLQDEKETKARTHETDLTKTISNEDIRYGLNTIKYFVSRYGGDAAKICDQEFYRIPGNIFDINLLLNNKNILNKIVKWDSLLLFSGPFASPAQDASLVEHTVLIGIGSGCVPYLAHTREYLDLLFPRTEDDEKRIYQKLSTFRNIATLKDIKDKQTNPKVFLSKMSDKMPMKKIESLKEVTMYDRIIRLCKELLFDNVFYVLWVFIAIYLELSTSFFMMSWEYNGVMNMQNNTLRNILWPILLDLNYFLIVNFSFHVLVRYIVFGTFQTNDITYKSLTKKQKFSRMLMMLDVFVICFSLIASILNKCLPGAYKLNDYLPQSDLPGGVISALSWDHSCYAGKMKGTFCDIVPHWDDKCAVVLLISIVLCSVYRLFRFWGTTNLFQTMTDRSFSLMQGRKNMYMPCNKSNTNIRWMHKMGGPHIIGGKVAVSDEAKCKRAYKAGGTASMGKDNNNYSNNERSMKTIDLIWITRSLTWVHLLNRDLTYIMGLTRSFNLPIKIRIHVTDNRVTQEMLDKETKGTVLEGCFFYGRADFNKIFDELYHKYIEKVRLYDEKIGIFYTGPITVQETVKSAFYTLRDKVMSYCLQTEKGKIRKNEPVKSAYNLVCFYGD